MKLSRLALLLAVAAALAGCQSFRQAAGVDRSPPDEFAVMPKAPLVLPPDYSLHPPKAGSRESNAPDPSEQARAALYPSNPQQAGAALGTGYSDGEKLLLAYAGAVNASPAIRQTLAADAGQDEEGGGFADKVLFWQGPGEDPTAQTVDAKAEAERLKKAQATGQPAAPDKNIRGTSQ